MNLRRSLGLSLIAAAFSISLPAILSAQSDAVAEQSQVRIKLLESGEIEVSGDVVFEFSEPEEVTGHDGVQVGSVDGKSVGSIVTAGQIRMVGNGFVVNAHGARVERGADKSATLRTQSAVISKGESN